MRAIPGGTAKTDRLDAHKLAALLRGGLMPQADVYPRRMRATRDRLRRSNQRMHQRAEVYAHIQHTASQYHLSDPLGRIATPQNRRGLLERFDHRGVQKNLAVDVALVDVYDPLLAALARDIEQIAHGHDPVALALVRTIPGVGNILALVRLDEIAQITRFPRVQAFVASCRLGKSAKESKGQRYGTSGQKLGNAPRTWAVSEAAGRLLTNNEPAQQYLATLATRHGKGKALSILAHQLGRAVYFMRKQPVAVDQAKCLATEGGRQRTSLASPWSHRGQRHATGASRRAIRLVGQEPAPAVPGPRRSPGSLAR
jgi:transposase